MTEAPVKSAQPSTGGTWLVPLLNLLATVQVVWFYLARVECYIKLQPYEQGLERTPFQYRLLMMLPLRWAHASPRLQAAALWLTRQRGFFPGGVRAEGILEASVDLCCVAVAGLVARELYQRSSSTRVLTPYVYPLTLLMVLCNYALLVMHSYRFVYDLPALLFFSLGLYLIYVRKHGWFAAVFLIGTINRETTLLLLVFFLLAECSRGATFAWRAGYAFTSLRTVLPLAAAWLGWHLWLVSHFRANASIARPRVGLNLSLLAVPITWPQIFCAFSYLLPLVILGRRHIRDHVLRRWLWAMPVWAMCMLYYGVFVEVRIFGELIPYVACAAALVAEEKICRALASAQPPASAGWLPGLAPELYAEPVTIASAARLAASGISDSAKGTKIRTSASRPTTNQLHT